MSRRPRRPKAEPEPPLPELPESPTTQEPAANEVQAPAEHQAEATPIEEPQDSPPPEPEPAENEDLGELEDEEEEDDEPDEPDDEPDVVDPIDEPPVRSSSFRAASPKPPAIPAASLVARPQPVSAAPRQTMSNSDDLSSSMSPSMEQILAQDATDEESRRANEAMDQVLAAKAAGEKNVPWPVRGPAKYNGLALTRGDPSNRPVVTIERTHPERVDLDHFNLRDAPTYLDLWNRIVERFWTGEQEIYRWTIHTDGHRQRGTDTINFDASPQQRAYHQAKNALPNAKLPPNGQPPQPGYPQQQQAYGPPNGQQPPYGQPPQPGYPQQQQAYGPPNGQQPPYGQPPQPGYPQQQSPYVQPPLTGFAPQPQGHAPAPPVSAPPDLGRAYVESDRVARALVDELDDDPPARTERERTEPSRDGWEESERRSFRPRSEGTTIRDDDEPYEGSRRDEDAERRIAAAEERTRALESQIAGMRRLAFTQQQRAEAAPARQPDPPPPPAPLPPPDEYVWVHRPHVQREQVIVAQPPAPAPMQPAMQPASYRDPAYNPAPVDSAALEEYRRREREVMRKQRELEDRLQQMQEYVRTTTELAVQRSKVESARIVDQMRERDPVEPAAPPPAREPAPAAPPPAAQYASCTPGPSRRAAAQPYYDERDDMPGYLPPLRYAHVTPPAVQAAPPPAPVAAPPPPPPPGPRSPGP